MTQLALWGESLAAAKVRVAEGLSDGIVCPCCHQYAREYRRKLNSGMALALIGLVRLWLTAQDQAETYLGPYHGAWIHLTQINEWVRRGQSIRGSSNPCGDFAKLRYWGLIEEEPNEDPGKRKSGSWRPSATGTLFVKGLITVHGYARVYNGECAGLEGDPVSIRDALDDQFDYAELMAQ